MSSKHILSVTHIWNELHNTCTYLGYIRRVTLIVTYVLAGRYHLETLLMSLAYLAVDITLKHL